MTLVVELEEAVIAAVREGRSVTDLARLLDEAREAERRHRGEMQQILARDGRAENLERPRETQRELALRTLREEGRPLGIGEWGVAMRSRGNPHPRGTPRDPDQLFRSLGSFLWRETHHPGGKPRDDGILVEIDGKAALREWQTNAS
jgi:hypothetical protein